MIIVVSNIKDGSGKTTIAANLAVIRSLNLSDVLIIDAGTKESASSFTFARDKEGHHPEIICASIHGKTIGAEIKKLTDKFDDIIVDVSGANSLTLNSAISVADVLVIPFLADQIDSSDITLMDEIISTTLKSNKTFRALAILNKLDEGTMNKLLLEKTTHLSSTLKNIIISKNSIGNRIDFRRSIADGVSVTELPDKTELKSGTEIISLYKEVFGDE